MKSSAGLFLFHPPKSLGYCSNKLNSGNFNNFVDSVPSVTYIPFMARIPQLNLLKKQKDAYGGELRNTRLGRMGPRPIATRFTMHLVLGSSMAVGKWSFKNKENEKKIDQIVEKFANKYGVTLISLANVGNHLHLQIKLGNRYTYKRFIRAITAAIMMAITGASRWNPLDIKFWDHRPFTQVVRSLRQYLNLKDYLEINRLQGFGCVRAEARWIVKVDSKLRPWMYAKLE